MKNKKAIQLSVNFIVILIIALVVFAFGVNFMYDLITKADEIREDVDESTQREIEAALTSGDIVSIPINHKDTKPGNSVNFGLGIFNIEKTQSFTIEMSFESAYSSRTKAPISVNGDEWIIQEYGPYELPKNEQKIVGLPIRVPRNIESGKTPEGVYSFNIEVKDQEGLRYGNLQKVRVTVI
jgi:hypothetical protein